MKVSFTKYMKAGWNDDKMSMDYKPKGIVSRRVMRRDVKRWAERKFEKDHKGDDAWRNMADYLS
jgi:hypothetical protein